MPHRKLGARHPYCPDWPVPSSSHLVYRGGLPLSPSLSLALHPAAGGWDVLGSRYSAQSESVAATLFGSLWRSSALPALQLPSELISALQWQNSLTHPPLSAFPGPPRSQPKLCCFPSPTQMRLRVSYPWPLS